MPITFQIDAERRRVDARATGDVTLRELIEYAGDRARAGASSYEQLFDARGARINLSTAEVEEVIRASQQARGGVPFGQSAVVADVDITYGVARMAEILSQYAGMEARVFRVIEDAEQWLAGQRRLAQAGEPD
jgi:hypothetical protein